MAKPKSNFDASSEVRMEMRLEVRNTALIDVNSTAQENDVFSELGFNADRWKAYMDFDIVHCMPAIIGPVSEGFYTTYLPSIVQASHGSLMHQQVNLNHLLKAYSTEDDQVAKDRIVGCVVATYFPPEPAQGWKIGDDPTVAPAIRARAVIFKLADGVNRMIGDHQTSRKKQSLSIESVTTLGNLGVYLPSKGADQIMPLMEAIKDASIASAIKMDPLKLGKVNGEQGVFVYGIKNPVEFRGVGITPRPAEQEAKIISFEAHKTKATDGGTLIAMAAKQVDLELEGRKIKFSTGRVGKIDKVINEGEARLPGQNWSMTASEEEPVLQIQLNNKQLVLRRLSEVAERIVS